MDEKNKTNGTFTTDHLSSAAPTSSWRRNFWNKPHISPVWIPSSTDLLVTTTCKALYPACTRRMLGREPCSKDPLPPSRGLHSRTQKKPMTRRPVLNTSLSAMTVVVAVTISLPGGDTPRVSAWLSSLSALTP